GAVADYSVAASDNVGTPNVAYTQPSGTVFPIGTTQVTVTATDSTGNLSTGTFTVTVPKISPTLAWSNPASVTYKTPLSATELNATALFGGNAVSGTYSYSPALGTELSAGTHILSVSFVPSQTQYFLGASGSASIVVNKALPALAWADPAAITYKTVLSATELNAAASFGENAVSGTYSYSPALGTLLSAGTHTLNVSFSPDSANYSPVIGTASIVVNKATPSIQWNPAPLIFGNTLGAAQLNATAIFDGTVVAGNYAYNPTGGTLSLGTSTLSVSFVPTDTSNFNPTSGMVSLPVVDQTLPVVMPPRNVTAFAFDANGANVSYDPATATDDVGVVGITYSKNSGTVFPVGSTAVIATAADAAGNLGTGTFTVTVIGGSSASSLIVPSGSILRVDANRSLGLLSGSGEVQLMAGGQLSLTGGGSSAFSGLISGSGSFLKAGSGNFNLSGVNTFSGGFTLTSGTVFATNGGALGVGSLYLSGGKLTSDFGTQLTFSNPLVMSGTVILGDALSGGPLVFNGEGIFSSDATLVTVNSVVFNGSLGGVGGLEKDGNGDLVLLGNNSYLGETRVSSGTLFLGSASALPSTTKLSVSVGALVRLYADQQVDSLAGNGTLDLVSSTLTIAGATDSLFSGLITNLAGSMVKSGSSTLTATLGQSGAGESAESGNAQFHKRQ
ncbi:MAG: HYR domain-containing protein, partial [Verrucomicrobia bacterium]|nr:HYR domain-containing protein [Verrucomicrobiota bacterium]